jgi:hypothetical protein
VDHQRHRPEETVVLARIGITRHTVMAAAAAVVVRREVVPQRVAVPVAFMVVLVVVVGRLGLVILEAVVVERQASSLLFIRQ